jgi:hypothetical protein
MPRGQKESFQPEAVNEEVPRRIGEWFTGESILEDPHNVSADSGARKALVPDSRAFCIGSPGGYYGRIRESA